MRKKIDVVNSAVFAQETYDELVYRHEHKEEFRPLRSGLTKLDQMIGGIGLDWYMVVSGQSGIGKTAMITTFLKAMGEQNVKFLFNGLEESLYEVGTRMFSMISHVQRPKMRDLDVGSDPGEWPSIVHAKDIISRYGGFWTYGLDTLEDLDAAVQEIDPDFLVIDYVQLMGSRTGRNRAEAISEVSGYLNSLTRRKERPRGILAAAQLNQGDNALWSKDLERDAGIFLKVKNKMDSYGVPILQYKDIEIAKSRYSAVGTFEVGFHGANSLFVDSDELKPIGIDSLKGTYYDPNDKGLPF